VVQAGGVTIVGFSNTAARLAADASALYARNLLNFLTPMVDQEQGALAFDWEDEVVAGACAMRDGELIHPALMTA
jgi:NAD(P) transhydrogenase subunit alpha